MLKQTDTTARRTYFLGDPNRGRTTQLIEKATGELLIEVMGDVPRHEAYRQFVREHSKQAN